MARWSKLKQQVEERFADSVQGRVHLWSTQYRHPLRFPNKLGHACIIVDNTRVFEADTIKFYRRQAQLVQGFKELGYPGKAELFKTPETQLMADEILRKEGTLSQDQFYESLNEYLSSSIEAAVHSSDVVVRALAMLDRRLGKRRLAGLREVELEHPLEKRLFKLRCETEHLNAHE